MVLLLDLANILLGFYLGGAVATSVTLALSPYWNRQDDQWKQVRTSFAWPWFWFKLWRVMEDMERPDPVPPCPEPPPVITIYTDSHARP